MRNELTGLGHQYKKKEKAINACNLSLCEAFNHLKGLDDEEMLLLRIDIAKLVNRCLDLSYSINESFKQD